MEKKYEVITLVLRPKGKSGVQISSVPVKKVEGVR